MLLEAVAELCTDVRATVVCGRLGDKPFGPVTDLEGPSRLRSPPLRATNRRRQWSR